MLSNFTAYRRAHSSALHTAGAQPNGPMMKKMEMKANVNHSDGRPKLPFLFWNKSSRSWVKNHFVLKPISEL